MGATARLEAGIGQVRALALRDPLALGIAVSVLVHLMLLMLRFAPPTPLKFAPPDAQIEVILLNAMTANKPLAPEVRAQVDMEGGGDRDSGRATSPLPAELAMSDGNTLREQRRRVDELEAQQQRLLTESQAALTRAAPQRHETTPGQAPGADSEDLDRVIARLQAQIDRQISDYNKRPKRLTYGVNAVGVNYARYVEDWASRIERLGTERFPPEARGKMYDSLIITVEIDRRGRVLDIIINKKSRHEALNRAVRQIVHAGAPYEPFPPEMAREGDVLQIVRTWTFTNDTLATHSVQAPR